MTSCFTVGGLGSVGVPTLVLHSSSRAWITSSSNKLSSVNRAASTANIIIEGRKVLVLPAAWPVIPPIALESVFAQLPPGVFSRPEQPGGTSLCLRERSFSRHGTVVGRGKGLPLFVADPTPTANRAPLEVNALASSRFHRARRDIQLPDTARRKSQIQTRDRNDNKIIVGSSTGRARSDKQRARRQSATSRRDKRGAKQSATYVGGISEGQTIRHIGGICEGQTIRHVSGISEGQNNPPRRSAGYTGGLVVPVLFHSVRGTNVWDGTGKKSFQHFFSIQMCLF